MKDVNERIETAITELLGQSPRSRQTTKAARNLSPPYRVESIVMVASPYEYFQLEEGGRLTELFTAAVNIRHEIPPKIVHMENMRQALGYLSSNETQLLLIFEPEDMVSVVENLEIVKKTWPDIRTIVLTNTEKGQDLLERWGKHEALDHVLVWRGDGGIILNTVVLLEDMSTVEKGLGSGPGILLVSNNADSYSNLTNLLVEEASRFWEQHLSDIPPARRKMVLGNKPRVILAHDLVQAEHWFKLLGDSILGLVIDPSVLHSNDTKKSSDPGQLRAWVGKMLSGSDTGGRTVPTILLDMSGSFSALNGSEDGTERYVVINMGIPTANIKLKDAIRTWLLPREFKPVFIWGSELGTASSIRELEELVWSIPDERLNELVISDRMHQWLKARGELALSDSILRSAGDRMELVRMMEEHRSRKFSGAISRYSRRTDGAHVRFSKIGKGALGGKARGLAFIDRLISTYLDDAHIPDISVKIPRTLVISTDVFESFLESNKLVTEELFKMDDQRITDIFMKASLPATVLGDIRSFVRNIRAPLIVRSSSLLEDALHHPFAGVYASILLPNDTWETDIRFQDVCNAVKFVYASTFHQEARTYMETTSSKVEDERMAVIIQEVVGSKHGKYFYPNVSGVARSYNHYPGPRCKHSDGIASLALGLGKTIVDGGAAFHFCPVHPKIPQFMGLDDLMANAQRDFYAIDLTSMSFMTNWHEDKTLEKLPLEKADPEVLDIAASTYSPQDQKLYPGTGREGAKVVTFAPILEMDMLPLAKLVRLLLIMGEMSLGSPVEIEFAMSVVDGKVDLYMLQLRSMYSREAKVKVELGSFSGKDVLCRSSTTLGNGVYGDVRTIIAVDEGLDMAQSPKAAEEISRLNRQLMSRGEGYLLVGPGRWGSTDHWMGIPVKWSDIAGTKVIVETPVSERPIDPSQGSHFFHNMLSAKVGYMCLTGKGDIMNWDWLAKQKVIHEANGVRLIQLKEDLGIIIDGEKGQGLVVAERPKRGSRRKRRGST